MEPQYYDWTCSVCSFTWTINAIANQEVLDRYSAGLIIGYPNCVNDVYGCVSSDCLVSAYSQQGIRAIQRWVSFDEAYSICRSYTGCINPTGMYHYMAIRGVDSGGIWVANSAPGYKGVYDYLDRNTFNALGPVQVIYLESYL